MSEAREALARYQRVESASLNVKEWVLASGTILLLQETGRCTYRLYLYNGFIVEKSDAVHKRKYRRILVTKRDSVQDFVLKVVCGNERLPGLNLETYILISRILVICVLPGGICRAFTYDYHDNFHELV